MPVDLLQSYRSDCCPNEQTLVTDSLLLRSRKQEGWANGSPIDDIGNVIVAVRGYDPADFDGYFQTIETTLAYPIIEPGNGRVGTWTTTAILQHEGEKVVATQGEIKSNTTQEDDSDPASPQFVDFTQIDYDESDIIVSGKVTKEAIASFITSEIEGVEFGPYTPDPALAGYIHGIAESPGFSIGFETQWLPAVVPEDLGVYNILTEAVGGTVEVRWAVVELEPDSGEEPTTLSQSAEDLSWSNQYTMFVNANPAPDTTDTAPTGWKTFGELTAEKWYRVKLSRIIGDIYPMARRGELI